MKSTIMNRSTLTLLTAGLISLSACKDEKAPVLLASGTYAIESNTSYGGPEDADLDGFFLELDVDALTAGLVGTSDDRVLDLTLLPREQWGGACPIGGSLTPLETFEVQESITLVGVTLEVPYILADGCRSDEGTTVSRAWISSEDIIDTSMSGGPFNLVAVP